MIGKAGGSAEGIRLGALLFCFTQPLHQPAATKDGQKATLSEVGSSLDAYLTSGTSAQRSV